MKLVNYVNIQQDIFDSLKEKALPFRTSYKLTKFLRFVDDQLAFYRGELSKILKDCAEQDSNGDFKIKAGLNETCQKRIEDLLQTEVDDCDVFFTLDELESLNFTVAQMNSIFPFIKE